MRSIPTATLLLVFACQSASIYAEDNACRQYSLKQDEPSTGTHIRQEIVTGSVLPLDKRYEELSLAEQSYVKSQYERLGPTDEPPFPINGLRPIFKAIALGQQKLRVVGDLTLFVEVNSQGQPLSASVLRSPDPEMSKFAASVLMLQRYKPALCNGTPCTMQYPFRMSFDKQL